jgi:hypothetical protein
MNICSQLKKGLVEMFFWASMWLTVVSVFPESASAFDLLSMPEPTYTAPASAGGDSYMTGISSDARYVLLGSTANNLARRMNGKPYIMREPRAVNSFLRDRFLGTTILISSDPTDTYEANSDAFATGISTNGQYIVFESGATNLVAGDTNPVADTDIFVRDVINKSTTLVTVGLDGASANDLSSESAITPDGRFVVFSSAATNLVSNDTNGISDVFVRDLQLGVTRLVSVGAKPATASALSSYGLAVSKSECPVITPDGKFVAFISTATNILPDVTTFGDVYVRSMATDTTLCVSTNAKHYFSSGKIQFYSEKISDDGQFVVFQGALTTSPTNALIFRHNIQTGDDDVIASNAIPTPYFRTTDILDMTPDGRFVAFIGANGGTTGVYVWDAQTASTTQVSIATNGTSPAKLNCEAPTVSEDGRFALFVCDATNLTTNAVAPGLHLYRRDLQAGVTELIDVGTNQDALMRTVAGDSAMSADGRYVVFDCADADIVTNDNNESWDVFLRDLTVETTELISVHQPSLFSQTSTRRKLDASVAISTNEQYVVFSCKGEGLVSGYSNNVSDVYVRDLVNQSNFLVSVDTNGLAEANGDSFEPVISSDGRYVAFTSYATNLVVGDTNKDSDVFIRDLQNPVPVLVSVNASGEGSLGGGSSSPSISAEGKYVLFLNGARAVLRDTIVGTNFVLATNATALAMTPDGRYSAFFGTPTGANPSIYIWDSQLVRRIYTNIVTSVSKISISANGEWLAYVNSSGATVVNRITKTSKSLGAIASLTHSGFRFSGDGHWFVYATARAGVADDTNGLSDVYLYDTQSTSNFLVSRSFYSGKAPMGASDSPDISMDGRFIIYASTAADIVPADDNSGKDIFLYDQQSGVTTILSASGKSGNSANSISMKPSFTGNGQTAVFHTWASDLTESDFNQADDLLAVRISSTNSLFYSTNPPPVFAGEIIFAPGGVGSNPRLNWAVVPGIAYQVQFKDDLTDADWQPINGSIVIEGSQGSVLDLTPNPDHRFYRLVAY